MQVKRTPISDTKVTLTITATAKELAPIKEIVLKRLGKDVTVTGFRPGKAPLHVIEKNLNADHVQTEFLDEAAGQLYVEALENEKLRPVSQPKVSLKAFVPYTELAFEAEVEIVSEVKLPDYKAIRLTKKPVKITAKDISEVIESLKSRAADKKEVTRAAAEGDQVTINFTGTDSKSEPVKGAEGKDYPLTIGSNTFIPGFEPNLIGLKPKQDKTFTVTFPKDYGVKALQGKKVTFAVTLNKVEEIIQPKLDDDFAAKVGPFKTVAELKDDITKQLTNERQYEADRDLENDIVKQLIDKTKVSIPESLIDEQVERLLKEVRQNLVYRGQTFEEMLEIDGKTEAEYLSTELRPRATERVKGGLILGEIAEKEEIQVTPEELEIRLQLHKGQYDDPAMQAELDKPENRRDIVSRLVTEKTLVKLVEYATK